MGALRAGCSGTRWSSAACASSERSAVRLCAGRHWNRSSQAGGAHDPPWPRQAQPGRQGGAVGCTRASAAECLADSPTATIDLSLADYHLPGATRGDRAGWPVATAGDVDGDGLDDILIGAAYNDEGAELAGAVHLVLGSTLTASVEPTLNLADADVPFLGEDEGEELSRVSSAGAYGLPTAAGKAYLLLSCL